jgi:RNA polymerase sigma-54 factor
MKMTQELKQQQKLVLTNEMQQSLKILQMPIFELQENIEKELEDNPLLEIIDEGNEETASEDKDNSYEADGVNYNQLIKDNEYTNHESISYDADQNDKIDPLNFIIEKKTLKDYLMEQIIDLREEDKIICICNFIIESIDEKGYLSCSVEEIAKELKLPVEEVNYALNLVQNFQPWGIAARNLKECLTIQLIKRNIEDENLYKLVDEYLELIADNKIKEIAKKLDIDTRRVQEYFNIIKSLEPKPSRGFNTCNLDNYVIPEAYIRKIGDDCYVLMNETNLPRLSINPLYRDLIKSQVSGEALGYVKDKLNSAVYLIKGIEQRKRTIHSILEKIVGLQKEYFNYGEQYLKPMTIADIASILKIHESTISRAIKDKYISTPYKTIKIKDLFTSGIESNSTDESVSANYIKKEIRKLIENEDKSKPLSDQDICNVLRNGKFEISRRTVAKYREEIGISSSSKRKVYS